MYYEEQGGQLYMDAFFWKGSSRNKILLFYKAVCSLSTRENQLKCSGSAEEGELTPVWRLGNSGGIREEGAFTLGYDRVIECGPSENINNQYSFNTWSLQMNTFPICLH